MTHISPRAARDMSAHFTRMEAQARHARWATLARDLTIALALLSLATLTGWALATAQDLCTTPQPAALTGW